MEWMQRIAVVVLSAGLVLSACSDGDGSSSVTGPESLADDPAETPLVSGGEQDLIDVPAESAPTTTVDPPPDTPAPIVSDGCQPGEAPTVEVDEFGLAARSLESSGGIRDYLVYVPDTYSGSEPAMLVFNFHGAGSNKEQQVAYAAFGPFADVDGAIVVAPDAVAEVQRWSPFGAQGPADDLAFFDDLLAAVGAEFCVDPTAVMLTGMSSGGFMSASVACTRSEVVAAVAPVTATAWVEGVCGEAVPIPYTYFHGTDDGVVPFLGPAPGPEGEPGPGSAEFSASDWAAQNGCNADPVDEMIGTDVVHRVWQSCEASTSLYIVEGGGHTWPGGFPLEALGPTTDTIDATEIIWEQFRSAFRGRLDEAGR